MPGRPRAERVEKISEKIRQPRHRRDELTFMLDLDGQTPDTAHLHEIRDRIIEVIDTGQPRNAKHSAAASAVMV
jgi:hypothetical protein